MAAGLAQGAFYGARGNSGVILSQFFRGFADALDGHDALSGPDLVRAFDLATQAAYHSVGEPVEGTMVTVLRRASEAITDQAANGGAIAVEDLWNTAFQAAVAALGQTPEQLPVLKQAGVVDSGGMGIAVIIGGALQVLAPGSNGSPTEL